MDLDPKLYENIVVNDTDIHNVVLSYLVHNCFKDTVESFISCTNISQPVDCLEDIDRRRRIIEFALNGNVLRAIELTEQLAPDLLQKNDDLRFDLLGLHFVELVRSRPSCEAVEFAKKQLRPFSEVTEAQKFMGKIEDHMALLAYNEPEKSPMFRLLGLDYRHEIADKLNRAILAHFNKPHYSSLERLIQQTTVVRQLLNQDSSKDGLPLFSLKDFVKR
ncbi:uncharacterized protein LOC141596973 [Silene latifolia]|uniref:uncharacterized protein LOC141596973 n=1 Tax=Silene latifolia TaxID=37657 RepID=UPI003D7875F6